MSFHVIALVDEGKPTWTAIPLSTHDTLADCMAEYNRQKRVFRDGGFATDVMGVSVQADDSGGATDTQPVATERTNERTKGR